MDTPAEDAAIEKVVDRLATRFPSVDHAHVEEVVEEEAHEFDDARVRDFVPVIVEHQAKDRLREEADPVPLTESALTEMAQGQAQEVAVEGDQEKDPIEIEQASRSTGLLYGDLENN